MRALLAASLVLGLLALPFAAVAQESPAPRPDPMRAAAGVADARLPGRYIVSVATRADRRSLIADFAEDMRVGRRYHRALIGFVAKTSAVTALALERDPRVLAVEADQSFTLAGVQAPAPWGLDRIDQAARPRDGQYTYTSNGGGVNAYVVDTGLYRRHRDFQTRTRKGYDATGKGTTRDCNGHGTHVAATIAGTRHGVAKKARIVPVRVANCRGRTSASRLIAGLEFVVRHHKRGQPAVVNVSLGGPGSAAVDRAVRRVINDGVIVVTAAGNAGWNACAYSPGRVPRALTVGATDRSDTAPHWSNFGPCVDLFAPGKGITSAGIASRTASRRYSGTSMAAPHVAGAAARLLSQRPGLAPKAVARRLKRAAAPRLVSHSAAQTTSRLLHLGARVGTRLTIAVSPTQLASGDRTAVQATLRTAASGAPIPGRRVVLQYRPAGDTAWTRVGARLTDSRGTVTIPHTPPRRGQYRLRHPRSATTKASRSTAVTVAVDTRLATRAVLAGDGGPVTAGDTVTLGGVLTSRDGDALPGLELRLYARSADTGTWTLVAQALTDATGTAGFTHTPLESTDYQLRHAATSTTLGVTSALWTVNVW